ncbi:hypothetical protein [Hymenobacter siberiensis]|uniref:hypothetical protein n=1 Tax=Hymenobacter siberiensis TaxID=2848396 RepID=UPI001D00D68E|nr:hypothetical protein [Hymenobacter siberiensis]
MQAGYSLTENSGHYQSIKKSSFRAAFLLTKIGGLLGTHRNGREHFFDVGYSFDRHNGGDQQEAKHENKHNATEKSSGQKAARFSKLHLMYPTPKAPARFQ